MGVGFRDDERVVVVDVVLGENVAEGGDTFYLDPRATIEAYRYSELRGYDIVSVIHTHRYGTEPSKLDLEGMRLWPMPWVIISEDGCAARAWVLSDGELRELGIADPEGSRGITDREDPF